MKKEDIVIGTTYRIREWDDMAQEFGLDSMGNIPVNEDTSFLKEMKCLCGQLHTVTGFDTGYDDGDCLPDVKDCVGNVCGVTAGMLEPIPGN